MSDPTTADRDALLPLFANALDFAAAQARRILRDHPGYTPMYTVGGRWNQEGERWTHWCEGFFPGILWLLHRQTGDAEFRRHAEQFAQLQARIIVAQRLVEVRREQETLHV